MKLRIYWVVCWQELDIDLLIGDRAFYGIIQQK